MHWTVEFHPEFAGEFAELGEVVQDRLLAKIELLREFGPRLVNPGGNGPMVPTRGRDAEFPPWYLRRNELGRPHADTLNGSRYNNMKELRLSADGGAWRVAFAFDPKRQAILLVAGDKSGSSESRFYRSLIDRADERFTEHLAHLEE